MKLKCTKFIKILFISILWFFILNLTVFQISGDPMACSQWIFCLASGNFKTTSPNGLWNIFHKKLMITSIAEFSHSNRTTAFSHDQVDRIFPVLKRYRLRIRFRRISSLCLFKTGNIPSTWSWLNAVVRFEYENSAIDVIINFLWKIFHKPIVLVVLNTANFGGRFSNFCRYYTRSQTGKSTRYRPTLKPLNNENYHIIQY